MKRGSPKSEHGYIQMSIFDFIGFAQPEESERQSEWDKFLSDNWMKGGQNLEDRDPMVAACTTLVGAYEAKTKTEAKTVAKRIASTATYHFANMDDGRYALTVKTGDRLNLVLISPSHIVIIGGVCDTKDMDAFLKGEIPVLIGAMYIKVFDKKGNIINRYADGDADIRQEACMADWSMAEFSKNRIDEKKPVKEFYEVSFRLPDLVSRHKGKGTQL